MALSRDTILSAVRGGLEPLGFVHAMWEGGAAAFNRVDQWSDIDLLVLCDNSDETVREVFRRVEECLDTLSPIELTYRVPQPSWHGHAQAFYRLADAGPFLVVDFVVVKEGSNNLFREQEIHGDGPVHFDKKGLVGREHVNPAHLAERLQRRLADLRVTFDLFQSTVLKELHRGNPVEALQYYHAMTLRPLLELARILHKPARHAFHTRYFYSDLPQDIACRMEALFFVADMDDLRRKHRQAAAWFYEMIDSANVNATGHEIGSAAEVGALPEA